MGRVSRFLGGAKPSVCVCRLPSIWATKRIFQQCAFWAADVRTVARNSSACARMGCFVSHAGHEPQLIRLPRMGTRDSLVDSLAGGKPKPSVCDCRLHFMHAVLHEFHTQDMHRTTCPEIHRVLPIQDHKGAPF
jgi:hypothetical protein